MTWPLAGVWAVMHQPPAPDGDEPGRHPVPYDTCHRCKHGWHGLRCLPWPNAPADFCDCPTSIEDDPE